MRDFYEILNVDRNATDDELKASYRKLAKKYHPDLNPGDADAEHKFKEVQAAYEVLSDSEKRKIYDLYGEEGLKGGMGGGQNFGGFGDIFNDIFDIFGGGGFSQRRGKNPNAPKRGADLRYDLKIDFKEAYFGTEKEISISHYVECDHCHGEKCEPGTEKKTCPTCHGTGEVTHQVNSAFGQYIQVSPCGTCMGTGEIIEKKCTKCNGQGKVKEKKKIKLNVPKGVNTGNILTMAQMGDAGDNKGPAGDLYVYIRVKEDEIFKREGPDLFIDMPVTYTDAVLGGEIKVPTMEGVESFDLPKKTEGGKMFKLKGKGMPIVNSDKKGDLYFKTEIIIPDKVTAEEKDLLLQLKNLRPSAVKEKKNFFSRFKEFFEQ